jgi:hypothetical protein
MKSTQLTWVSLLFIAMLQAGWAVPLAGAARFGQANRQKQRGAIGKTAGRTAHPQPNRPAPLPVSFRASREQGLLADAWINGSGPYTLAIDTGAGSTIISDRLADEAHVTIYSGRPVSLSGLSGRERANARSGIVNTLALGQEQNYLPTNRSVIISSGLPPGLDGILDPTEAFSPFGYEIDLPHRQLSAFDCATRPLSFASPPQDGAVVRWLTDRGSRRPFVRLDDGRQALLDTGSSFGLALAEGPSTVERRNGRMSNDIGGGSVTSRRLEPTTIGIGALTLRRVPTDLLSGVEKGAPVLLGRAALAPFRLTFDPLHHLIAIGPAER